MKTRSLLLTCCAVLALLATFAHRAKRDAAEAEAATAALVAQNGQLRTEVNQRETRLREARTLVAPAKSPSANPRGDSNRPVAATTKSATDTARKAAATPWLTALPIIANDPAKRSIYLANFRAQLDLDYGGMFKALRLSPEQIEKFKDLEVWLEQERIAHLAMIEAQQLDPNGAEAGKLWGELGKSRTEKRNEILGDLTPRYREYFFSASVREQVQKLAGPDLVPGQTVTAAQVERTTDILIANSQRKSGEGHGVEPGTVNWPAAHAQLNGILSPAQIEWLGMFVEEEAASVRVGQLQAKLTAQFRSKSSGKHK